MSFVRGSIPLVGNTCDRTNARYLLLLHFRESDTRLPKPNKISCDLTSSPLYSNTILLHSCQCMSALDLEVTGQLLPLYLSVLPKIPRNLTIFADFVQLPPISGIDFLFTCQSRPWKTNMGTKLATTPPLLRLYLCTIFVVRWGLLPYLSFWRHLV